MKFSGSTFFRSILFPLLVSSFLISTAAASFAGSPIRIIRDEFGVPHVYARNERDLFFGYGYVTAEDRLFQIEMLRRSVQGRVSEVMGAKFLELDRVALRDGYSILEVEARLATANPRHRDLLEMFARGVNARLAEVRRDPGLVPVEFIEFKFRPSDWTAADVASVFIGTMAVRYSDFTSEMDNLNLANFLSEKFGNETAKKIFNDVVPVEPAGYPTTACAQMSRKIHLCDAQTTPVLRTGVCGSGRDLFNSCEAQTTPVLRTGVCGSGQDIFDSSDAQAESFLQAEAGKGGRFVSGYPGERSRLKKTLASLGMPSKLGSYFYSVSGKKSASGNSLLAAGPQMGFFNPAYLFEVGLHSPEYSVVGTTTPCYMNVMFGMNADIAFSATAGVGNLTDVYVEKLNPRDRSEYLFEGNYRKFEKRKFEIAVKGRKRPVRVEFLRSVHGPVFEVDEKKGVAFSKRRAWEFAEIETMFAWMDAAGAPDLDSFRKACEKIAVSINMFASDRSGNIMFYLAGKYPVRARTVDDRLPQPGDGPAEWKGFLPASENPCSFNPACGYLANWNARPNAIFRNGDLSTGWGPDQRTRLIRDLLDEKGAVGMDDLFQINKKIGRTDVRAHIFMPAVLENLGPAGSTVSATVEAALSALAAWDGTRRDDDDDGLYDSPGVALFDALWPEMMNGIFGDELAANLRLIDSDPTWTQSGMLYYVLSAGSEKTPLQFDYTNGRGAKALVREAAVAACAKLASEYGTNDTKKWLKKFDSMVFDSINFAGIPQTSADNRVTTDCVNRGTENHFVELGARTTAACNVNPPGQSAFRSRDVMRNSPHLRDQMELFTDYKGYKPVHWSIADVLAKKTSEKFIIAR